MGQSAARRIEPVLNSGMDRFIAAFPAVRDGDLMLCDDYGVTYQADMDADPVEYGQQYFDNYVGLKGQEIARKINAARVGLVDRFVGPARPVLDVGVGSGEFIQARGNTYGHDVNPVAIEWLKARGLFVDVPVPDKRFSAFTFWDVIEHLRDPYHYLRNVPVPGFLFTSLPIFADITKVRESRHYKPGEHLYYFTENGFVSWIARYGFRLLERNDDETVAGRDSILSFAFKRESAP